MSNAPTPAIPPTPGPNGLPTPTEIVTLRDLVIAIRDTSEVGSEITELPQTAGVIWYAEKTAEQVALLLQQLGGLPPGDAQAIQAQGQALLNAMAPRSFAVGSVCPIDSKGRMVFEIYDGDTTDVYCIALQNMDGDRNKALINHKIPPVRYRLRHEGPYFSVETMPIWTWILELAAERDALDEATAKNDDDDTEPVEPEVVTNGVEPPKPTV